jgi:tRNA 2-thiouridine synthesizing protein E
MGYMIEGVEQQADEEGYLLEANFSDEAPPLIAQAEGITLTDAHWEVIRFMRERYREDGQTPNFRNMLKGFAGSVRPGADSKYLYDLFPAGPAKQAAKIAGLPKPYGKGGY